MKRTDKYLRRIYNVEFYPIVHQLDAKLTNHPGFNATTYNSAGQAKIGYYGPEQGCDVQVYPFPIIDGKLFKDDGILVEAFTAKGLKALNEIEADIPKHYTFHGGGPYHGTIKLDEAPARLLVEKPKTTGLGYPNDCRWAVYKRHPESRAYHYAGSEGGWND